MKSEYSPTLHYGSELTTMDQDGKTHICSTVKKVEGGTKWEYDTVNLAKLEKEAHAVIEKMKSKTKKQIYRACYRSMWKHNDPHEGVLNELSDNSLVLKIALSDVKFCHHIATHLGQDKSDMIKLLHKMMVVGKGEIGKLPFYKDIHSYEDLVSQVDEICRQKMERMKKADAELPEPRKGLVYSCPFAFNPGVKKWLEAVWDEFDAHYAPVFEEFEENYASSLLFPTINTYHQKVKAILGSSDSPFTQMLYMIIYERDALKRNFEAIKQETKESEHSS